MPLDVSLQLDAPVVASVNSALVLATILMPLLSVDLVERSCGLLHNTIPHLGPAVARCLQAIAGACHSLRARQQLLFVIIHGAITYVTGDLIAQGAVNGRRLSQQASPSHTSAQRTQPSPPSQHSMKKREPSPDKGRPAIQWRPFRSLRAAVLGVLSDSLPFYYWSSALEQLDDSWLTKRFPLLIQSPGLLLGCKVAAHLLTFQPACTASYLLLSQLLTSTPLTT